MHEAKNENDLEHKEAKNHYQNKKKKKKSKKNEDSVRSLWDNFNGSNICAIGMPKEEEKEQEIGILFEKLVKENFPHLVKEIDM